jgi:hypothetical protein
VRKSILTFLFSAKALITNGFLKIEQVKIFMRIYLYMGQFFKIKVLPEKKFWGFLSMLEQ